MKNKSTMPCDKCAGTGQVIDPRIIGADMRSQRVKAGISLRRMAAEMGVTPGFLSDMEHGNRGWTHVRIADFHEILNQYQPE